MYAGRADSCVVRGPTKQLLRCRFTPVRGTTQSIETFAQLLTAFFGRCSNSEALKCPFEPRTNRCLPTTVMSEKEERSVRNRANFPPHDIRTGFSLITVVVLTQPRSKLTCDGELQLDFDTLDNNGGSGRLDVCFRQAVHPAHSIDIRTDFTIPPEAGGKFTSLSRAPAETMAESRSAESKLCHTRPLRHRYKRCNDVVLRWPSL